jgi:phage tail-like protein
MVAGLASPHPLGAALPALYQEDAFALRLTGALDEVLAPIFASLDGLSAYLDPALAPDDFLEWLSGWVGVTLDETWPIERRRQLVADATQLYRSRGTVAGLAAQVAIYTGGEVQVEDNGAATWSTKAGGAMPGTAAPRLRVRVTVDDPNAVSLARLEAVVSTAKPAHVPHTIEVVGRTGRGTRGGKPEPAAEASAAEVDAPSAADAGDSSASTRPPSS